MSQRSIEQHQLLIEKITHLFEHQICFNEFLGFRIQRLEPAPVNIEFEMRAELVGHYQYGRLHGGVISSVLDVTGGLAVMMGIADYYSDDSADDVMVRFAPLATIDMRVDYLRQGIGKRFVASAEIVRLGKRVAVTRSTLHNDAGSLIATGNANYVVS